MTLEVRFRAVPVEALRAFLEPLGFRCDWGSELDGIGFHWHKLPLSGSGVRATWCTTAGRAEYAGGQAAEPPAPGFRAARLVLVDPST